MEDLPISNRALNLITRTNKLSTEMVKYESEVVSYTEWINEIDRIVEQLKNDPELSKDTIGYPEMKSRYKKLRAEAGVNLRRVIKEWNELLQHNSKLTWNQKKGKNHEHLDN